MPNINVPLDDLTQVRAWKRRYAESIGKDSEDVTWTELILAYANSKVLPT